MSNCCATKQRSYAVDNHNTSHAAKTVQQLSVGTAADPVCDMAVKMTEKTLSENYQGSMYYFCSSGCQRKFNAEPTRYAETSNQSKAELAPAGVKWTCPMHPEIIRDAPGSCPICGMA